MKYLSKYYRPTEKEFLKLAEGFRQWITLEEGANRAIPPDAYKLRNMVEESVDIIESKAGSRIKDEQKQQENEVDRRAKATGSCPRCNEEVPVTVTTEIKIPKTGFTHDVVKCTVCKKEFTQKRPNNPADTVKWLHNFTNELRNIEPDGRPRWQHYGRTEADLIDLEQFYKKLKETYDVERKAYRDLVETDTAMDNALKDLTNQLLLIRIQQQQWNGGDAKA